MGEHAKPNTGSYRRLIRNLRVDRDRASKTGLSVSMLRRIKTDPHGVAPLKQVVGMLLGHISATHKIQVPEKDEIVSILIFRAGESPDQLAERILNLLRVDPTL